MTMFEGEFECDNCAQTFPLNLSTIVRTQTEGAPAGKEPELTFHNPECSIEYKKRQAEIDG